jgi:hypothetical protein
MRLRNVLVALFVAGVMGTVVWLSQPNSNYARHEAAEREARLILKEFAAALESIKDAASARTAAARMNVLSGRMDALVTTMLELPPLTLEERKTLQDQWNADMGPLNTRLFDIGRDATRNAQGEPAFVAAVQRLERIVERMFKEIAAKLKE